MNRNMRSDVQAAACSACEQLDDGSLRQSFRFDEDFIGFAGHFPDYPVVPAIAQMLAAQLMIEQQHPEGMALLSVSHAKFLQQLPPMKDFRVECRAKTDNALCYDAKVFLDDARAASFRLTFNRREHVDD